jgi:NADH-quinone oxidoreductase subunit L
MFRQLFLVFHGDCRADDHTKAHIHESPPSMTVPLIVLAAGSIFAGWLGAPEYLWGSRWDRWLETILGAPEHHGSVTDEIVVTALTLAVVAMGIYLAYLRYGRTSQVSSPEGEGLLYRLSFDKFYVDEIYDRVIVRPFTAIARFCAAFVDPWVIDGVVNGAAATARGASWLWRGLQTGNVQHYVAGFLLGVLALLAYYIRHS